MAGRPSKYNQKLADEILRLYSSGKTILDIIQNNKMPSRVTIYRWRDSFPAFGKAYLIALDAHIESMIDDVRKRVMGADSKQAKLVDVQFKSISWLASKLNRAKYGDKIDIDITKTLDITPALADALKRMKEIEAPAKNVLDVPCEIIADSPKS